MSNNLESIKKNVILHETEKNKNILETLKLKKYQNPLLLIEDYERKKQLTLTKSGKNVNKQNLKDPLFQNNGIINKRKEIGELLGSSRNNDTGKKKNLYEGSSFLSPNTNRIIGELDIIKWRYNLNLSKIKIRK